MTLKATITTQHGLSIPNAILVVSAIQDERGDKYTYQLEKRPTPEQQAQGVHFNANEQNTPQRTTRFQVQVFASEEAAKEGKPPITQLANPQVPGNNVNFVFEFDDESAKSHLDQSYDHLMTLYPDAVECDLSTTGLS